jgi:hypothetical protein
MPYQMMTMIRDDSRFVSLAASHDDGNWSRIIFHGRVTRMVGHT